MKRLKLLALAGAAALAAALYLVHFDRFQGFSGEVFVDIPRGTSSLRTGARLAGAGVVRHPFVFLLARLLRPAARPQAGEYRFTTPATAAEVLARLARGDVYEIELRVPEGSDSFDIAMLVEAAGLGRASDFLKVALPHEGYLFPSTYFFRRNTPPQRICDTMRAEFERVWQELGGGGASRRQTVILASLVEAEAVKDPERPLIAGVYLNRLSKGMRLECDPTVKYAAKLEGHWKGAIYKSDLERPHRYNTYLSAGLPPGPITNPGRKSLDAALHPHETRMLYFVAAPGPGGGHVFNVEYSEHQKAVAAYRRGLNHAPDKSGNHRVAPGAARTLRR